MRAMTFSVCLAVAATALPAWAQEEPFTPNVAIDVAVELESDAVIDADDPAAEIWDTYNSTSVGVAINIHKNFSIESGLVFEPVKDAEDDRAFEDHGLYIEELFAKLSFDAFSVRAGKINPAFGLAWDAAPGIYGADFAEDYEQAEQIGGEVSIPFEAAGGEHAVTASVFFADNTGLSRSLFLDRGRNTANDGGAGNTGDLQNFAIVLDGEIGGVGYAVSGRRRAGELDGEENETGGAFALTKSFEVGSGELELIGEVAYFSNFEGADDEATYGTAGAAYGLGDFTLSGAYTVRDVSGEGTTDHLATTTLEYQILDSLSFGVGYKFAEEGGDSSHTVGALAVFEYGAVLK